MAKLLQGVELEFLLEVHRTALMEVGITIGALAILV